ncbi:MAG: hypothetical protein Q8J78_06700, partial [Moraxellaceae bacterium]|nr:hypothetical protein [Moraxellaceae bacterium]
MPPELAPTYYLDNFRTVLASVSAAYADLLNEEEADFLQRFAALSTDAQALLVRLVMRTRDVYVAGALDYPEIGGVPAALQDLAAAGWVDPDAALSLDELFATATKLQIVAGLADEGLRRSQSKSALREHLAHRAAERLSLGAWLASSSLSAVRLLVRPLMDRFRLLFFGNLYQDWSEFVITDLGHLRYETVSFGREARGFASRQDIDACLRIHVLRGQLEEEGDPAALQACLDDWPDSLSPHVRSRVHKLRFHVGNAAERAGHWPLAESLYLTCEYRGARHRLMRVYEQQGAWDAAFETAQAILAHPASEEEVQATHRALPRLARKLGKPVVKAKPLMSPASDELQLPERPAVSVEQSVAEALAHPPRAVHYVENALFGSLFGLTFWEVM